MCYTASMEIQTVSTDGNHANEIRRDRSSDLPENYIVVQPNGNLTMVGGDAYRLYEAVRNIRFGSSSPDPDHPSYHRSVGGKTDMRHLIEHSEPCDDLRPQLEHQLRVHAALLGADLDWPHFTCGPVALRREF